MALFLRFARYSDVDTVAARAVKRGCAVVMLAWVTWLHATTQDGNETWSISSATETLTQCLAGVEGAVDNFVSGTIPDRDQARAYQQLRNRGVTLRRLSADSVEGTLSNGTAVKVRFLCLPDTVDPRGPKEK
jgi:hypothetical protein